MINFELRTGPPFPHDPPRYPDREVPQWFRDAKLGIFVHWGLYSVPGWALPQTPRPVPLEDAYRDHAYAEWYGNTVRIAGSPTRQRHEQTYGTGTSYEDLADHWQAETFDAERFLSDIALTAGARYVVPTAKHHDGFCLWDTNTTQFNVARRGPRRDLVGEIAAATRAAGLRFGVYFSGALDWHVSDFPPIQSDADLFRLRRNDKNFARYAATQLTELIDQFRPDLLWNDIEWPDAGKGREPYGLAALIEHYLEQVPDGVINDRWGIPHHGFLTREYTAVDQILDSPWEATRGLGSSFGYNQAEGPEHTLSGADLVRYLIEVVSKNGNLLINVGPRADGTVPEVQQAALQELGQWLRTNGAGIYRTRPWLRPGQAGQAPLAFTTADDTVYIHALRPAAGWIKPPADLHGRQARWLGAGAEPLSVTDPMTIPGPLREQPVAVLACTR